jgi:hypothetical protein
MFSLFFYYAVDCLQKAIVTVGHATWLGYLEISP